MVMLVLSMALFVGCGKDTEENLSKTDTVGDAVIISETPQPAKATEEMNQENETAQKEQPQQNQTAEQPAQELVVDPEELQEPEIAPVEINEEVYDTAMFTMRMPKRTCRLFFWGIVFWTATGMERVSHI